MRRAVPVLAILASLTGCPSSSTPSSIPIEDLGAQYASAYCDLIEDCYGEDLANAFTNQTTHDGCVAAVTQAYQEQSLPRYEEAIEAGTLAYDGSQAGACVDALRALGCGITSSRSPAACRATLFGHVPAGGACSINEQCAGDASCRIESACPGSCQARVGAGAVCASNDDCQTGLICANEQCAAPAGSGASCQGETGLECAGGLICAGGSGTEEGNCRPIADVFVGVEDAACNVQMGQLCQEGLSCVIMSATSQTCLARVGIGETCGLSFPDQCGAGNFCEGTNLAIGDLEGTCAALPGAGDDCTAAGQCAPNLRCDGTTCRALSETGGSCDSGADCWSGTCDGSTCSAAALCH